MSGNAVASHSNWGNGGKAAAMVISRKILSRRALGRRSGLTDLMKKKWRCMLFRLFTAALLHFDMFLLPPVFLGREYRFTFCPSSGRVYFGQTGARSGPRGIGLGGKERFRSSGDGQ